MDEILTNVIEKATMTFRGNMNHEQEAHTLETFVSLRVYAAGYRLDPYPNGKSKDELIARIEAVEAERDKTRNLLMEEHYRKTSHGVTADDGCRVCIFLADTFTVKP